MKNWKKNCTMFAGVAAAAVLMTGTAWAKEDREKITSITLTIDADFSVGEEDGTLNVSTDSSIYSVSDVTITNDDGEWAVGDTPKAEVELTCDDDYYFASMSSSKVKLKGDDADYVSSKRSDENSTLTVTIKLDALEGDYELEDVEWAGDTTPVATWTDTEGTGSFQVRLYRNGSSVGSAITTTSTSYDFGSSFTRTGDYTFKVRAYKSGSKHGEWYESDAISVDDYNLSDFQSGSYSYYSTDSSSGTSSSPSSGPSATYTEGWVQDSNGWWYRCADGTWPANGWKLIDNTWYCFDASGYMRTGWILAGDGYYYYCDASGAMLMNTWTPDNYYVDSSGRWVQSMTR